MHQITNIDGENKIFAICNCNVNVCNALRTSQLFNTPNMSRSAYVAKVEEENCVACGALRGVLPRGRGEAGPEAVHEGAGRSSLPAARNRPTTAKWGPEKWTIDYRDKNRINCYDTGTAPCKTACPAHIARAGLPEDGRPGPLPRRAGADQKGEPLPRRVRAHLQPPVRGCLYPRHHRPGRGH